MVTFKIEKIWLSCILSICVIFASNVFCIYGCESDKENLNIYSHPSKKKLSSLTEPLSDNETPLNFTKLNQYNEKIVRNVLKKQAISEYQVLRLEGGLLAEQLAPLTNKINKEIYLKWVYEGFFVNDYFCKNHVLTISSETINPEVEILFLQGCGLKDKHIKRINDLKGLRHLCLESNLATDVGVKSIVELENLENLSLSANNLSDASLDLLSNMPNLTTLDISGNKQISDAGARIILRMNKLKNLNISFTGITKKMYQEIKENCRNIECLEYFPS